MTPRPISLRWVFIAVLIFVVGGLLAFSSYTLWRLRSAAISNGLEISAMHSRGFEDFLTQSLHVTELIAANAGDQKTQFATLRDIEPHFVTILRNTPFLRSMSLLDEQSRIIASSNPANIGIVVSTRHFLPQVQGSQNFLRIGEVWSGRDFNDGTPISEQTPALSDTASSFIPITHSLQLGSRKTTLLITLNPDYFVNHIAQKLGHEEGHVEVLRYDGIVLMATDPTIQAGSLNLHVSQKLQNGEIESGQFQSNPGGSKPHTLSAFRASPLYPFIVVTHIQGEHALKAWNSEAQILLGVMIPTLLAISILSIVFYRRQSLLAAQRAESARLQRISATVFDSSTEAILITDIHTRIMSVNPTFTRITGYPPEEIIGQQLQDFLTEDGQIALRAQTPTEASSSGVKPANIPPIEIQQRCKNGQLIWVEILSTPEYDAQKRLIGYHRISRNINDRRQAEEQLRLAANVFTHAHEGIVITDRNGFIIDVNQAFSRISGYPREEVIGYKPSILRSGRQDQAFYSSMWQALIQEGHWSGEIWNRKKDGTEYAELLTISAVRNLSGTVLNYVGTFSDITERKAVEIELSQHRHHLEELVLARTSELAEARDKAESANRAKSAFLANMGHELRTPMHAIMGMTDLALTRSADPKLTDYLNKSLRASQHLLSLINNVLELAKIEANHIAISNTRFSLKQVLDAVLEHGSEPAKRKELQLSQSIAPDIPNILYGDADHLQQILQHFLSNAIKFSDAGRIALSASAIEADESGIGIRITVTDQGIGISEDQKKILFQAFSQADESHTRKYGGIGLGLTIAKRLADLMGADIGLSSTEGTGSSFWISMYCPYDRY